MRASIKIPFRLIKWLSTLTNGKDLIVLGVLFPFSHNLQSPLFRGAASTACLGMLFPMAAVLCTFTAHQNSTQQLEVKHSLTKLTSKRAGGTWVNMGQGVIPGVRAVVHAGRHCWSQNGVRVLKPPQHHQCNLAWGVKK